ncbi:MAG: ribosomal protein S18 acetylase RimI-like enzyme [Crocinitomix sp.]|jgi:ribosomal protein S18 acetylase RimI-like enzyme
MIRIEIPQLKDLPELTTLAIETFIQSHGHSASTKDVDNYLQANYTEDIFKTELSDPNNFYRVLFTENKMVGYLKIIYNQPISAVESASITKLERIYVLEKFHGQGLGQELFNCAIDLSKTNGQAGVWLYTWIENKRAIRFYEKMSFKIVGSHDFQLSPTHTNPNHQMYLAF